MSFGGGLSRSHASVIARDIQQRGTPCDWSITMKTKMTISINQVDDAIDLVDVWDVEVKQYSGRGMYGEQCLGLVGKISACYAVIAALMYSVGAEDGLKLIKAAQVDSMGLDSVVYLPGVILEGGEIE